MLFKIKFDLYSKWLISLQYYKCVQWVTNKMTNKLERKITTALQHAVIFYCLLNMRHLL